MKNQLKNNQHFTNQTFIFFFILSIGTLFSSCGCYDEGSYPVEEEIKSYTVFPVGSWWVYENVATNELDTAKVLTTESMWEEEDHCELEWEEITQTILRHGNIWQTELFSLPSDEEIISFYNEGEQKSNTVAVNFFLKLNFPTSHENAGADAFQTHEVLDSTEIAGQTFYDIIETRLDTQRTVFSRGVGIIAITYEDGSSYVLKDYFIEE